MGHRSRGIYVSVSTLAVCAALTAPLAAHAADAAAAPKEVEEVVVTGTNIRGAAPTGSTVSVLGREAIDAAAPATADRLLRQLPQVGALGATEGVTTGQQDGASNRSYGNGVNLRSLGPDATLTLVNGHRVARSGTFANFTDISIIPTIAIERLEVVADGSSAIYGSDAIGGVVNLILRSNYDGVKIAYRAGEGDGINDWQASALVGKTWSTGSVTFAAERSYRSNLAAADRAYATQDMRGFGGKDYRSVLSSPGNIIITGTGVGAGTYPIPPGQNGVGLTAAQLRIGAPNLTDANFKTDLLPEQKRDDLMLTFKQSLGDRIDISGDAFYSMRRFNIRPQGATASVVTVPRANPFFVSPIAGAATVPVSYSFVNDLGPRNDIGYSKDQGYNGKVDFKITENWRATAAAFWSQNKSLRAQMNTVNNTALTAALADTNPATALNVFGTGNNNPATIDKIRARSDSKPGNEVYGYNVQANGPLFNLPGGPVQAAVGASYTHERFFLVNSDSTTGPFSVTAQDETIRSNKAVFAELSVPLVSDQNAMPLIQKLTLSLAGRAEKYSTAAGSTQNPKVGLVWTPADGLDFRASYGTSFKAPGIAYTTVALARLIQVGTIVDPTAGNANVTRLLRTGGNPGLKPETATTYSYGVDWRPPMLSGLRLSLTYYNVKYANRVGNPAINLNFPGTYGAFVITNPDQALVNRYTSGEFGRFVGVAPPAGTVKYIFDQRFQNLGELDTDGVDFAGSYDFETALGRVSLTAAATQILHFKNQAAQGLPYQERAGFSTWPADTKARADATLTHGPWRGSVGVQYTGKMVNDTLTPVAAVDPFTTVDLSVSYTTGEGAPEWLKGLQIQLTAENVFDKDPPFVENLNGATALYGFDPLNASPIGRLVAVRISKEW